MRSTDERRDIEPQQMEPRRIAWSKSRILFALARAGIGVAILVYLSRSGTIEWRAFSKLVTRWPITVAAIALMSVDVALIALRLCWLLRPLGLRLPFSNSIQLALVGFFFGTFLPGAAGGDVARIFYAARENSRRRAEIITVLIFDRTIGLFSLLVLPLLLAPLFPDFLSSVPVMRMLLFTFGLLAAAMLCAFLVMVNQNTMDWFARAAHRLFQRGAGGGRISGTFLETFLGTIRSTMSAYRHTGGILAAALGASLVANVSLVAVTALGVLALNPTSWVPKMLVIIPMGHVVNSLPLTPGGLGVGEAAFSSLFSAAGLRGGADALVCWRIWKALASLPGLAVYLRGFKLAISEQEPIANNAPAASQPSPQRRGTP